MDDDGSKNDRLYGARNRDGTVGKGNTLARGNPNCRKMFELRKALLDSNAASPNLVQAVFVQLCRLALGDKEENAPPDLEAMKLYLSYTVGKPVQAVEISGPDGEPLGLEWPKVEAAIIAALAPFGDQARFAVALALRGLVKDAGEPDPPGPPT